MTASGTLARGVNISAASQSLRATPGGSAIPRISQAKLCESEIVDLKCCVQMRVGFILIRVIQVRPITIAITLPYTLPALVVHLQQYAERPHSCDVWRDSRATSNGLLYGICIFTANEPRSLGVCHAFVLTQNEHIEGPVSNIIAIFHLCD